MRWSIDFNRCSVLGFAGNQALGKGGAGRACDATNRAKHRDKGGKIIWTHIEHRPPTRLIIKLRISMPTLVAMAQHEGCRSNRVTDYSIINHFDTGLDTTSQEGIRSTTDVALFGFSCIE